MTSGIIASVKVGGGEPGYKENISSQNKLLYLSEFIEF